MNAQGISYRALVVDDEVHGREVVKHMVRAHSDFSLIGEAANGVRALEEIRAKRPDVVFLDIRMPKLTGLALLDALAAELPPAVVFVTAHDTYAVAAFERYTLDYLLKPIDQDRFDRTLARVRERLQTKQDAHFGRLLKEILGSHGPAPARATEVRGPKAVPAGPETITRFVIKEAGRVFFIAVEAADWLEASGNYVGLHVGGKTHLIHETLSAIEQTLDSRRFLRIHRSAIVNVDRIKELQPFSNGEFAVILRDGTRLKLSRSFRDRANTVLGLG